ncbi:helix-turn-helix domain-containing protein [Pseudomonas gingeri]|uniref:helix-turn-helix domain-containing protein n=1 Tax=Pseudomonas gingeri TaxID=117681 RepID=UPI0015A2182A|nr:helix-turn-helix transcriptional regulator [Pseudomonas gingeri]NWE48704.1 helix-turn-helix transcriptional regulator [Pseudomonas gingeri]
MTSFGFRLKEERQRLALRQADFAQKASVSVSTQRLYEHDRRTPRAIYLANITRIGVDVLYVLTGRKTLLVDMNPLQARRLIDGKILNSEVLDEQADEEVYFKLVKRDRDSHQY